MNRYRDWLQQAQRDLKKAELDLQHQFWLRKLDNPPAPLELIEKAQLLDAYYITTRYPNGFPEGKPADYFSLRKAQEAVEAARAIIEFCENHIAGSGQTAG